jgi:hypothetical protein
MTIARAILALVIALSVAILPATGGFAVSGHSAMSSVAPCTHHGMSHPDHHGSPSDKATNDCGAMAACAIHCFGIYGLLNSNPTLAVFAAAIEPSFLAHSFLPHVGNPPFRPPRA